MDALQQPQPQLRYEGEERRRLRAAYLGEERRRIDPPTEQEHAEIWAELSGTS